MIQNGDFKDWLENFREHETYCMYNGELVLNNALFKVCPNNLKLIFNGVTTISNANIPDIPSHQFNFQSIEHFLNGHFQNDQLYGTFLLSLSLFGFIKALDYHIYFH